MRHVICGLMPLLQRIPCWSTAFRLLDIIAKINIVTDPELSDGRLKPVLQRIALLEYSL